ncbi:MAG: hypothetical protein ABR577_14330 [Pyrinomonadaceae bacterium]
MPTTLKNSVKVLVITVLIAVLSNFGAMTAYADLRVFSTADDGSFCAHSYGSSSGDFDVCYAVSTGEYTFFPLS